jgi:hypothetical protein
MCRATPNKVDARHRGFRRPEASIAVECFDRGNWLSEGSVVVAARPRSRRTVCATVLVACNGPTPEWRVLATRADHNPLRQACLAATTVGANGN